MSKRKEIKERAYYANGVYMTVLEEIISAQRNNPDKIFYLQPYSSKFITELRDFTTNEGYSWQFYASTSSDMTHIYYVADIVGWAHKQNIEPDELALLNIHIKEFQKGENDIYIKTGVNLISIRNLRVLSNPIPVSKCIKIEDGSPLKSRTQPGGWSYVYPLDISVESDIIYPKTLIDLNLSESINESLKDSDDKRNARLENAPKIPEKIQTVSIGFKRNPDVIVFVLKRANGICELCNQSAPFLRFSDKSDYLEVHHWMPLSEGGEDTIINAAALCPNCHKEAHFGINKEKIKLYRTIQ